jgi:predicted nucleotidyltransferase
MGSDMIDRESILRELRVLKPDLENRFGVTRIGIFGSVARGDIHPDSDIDVVVELQRPDLFDLVHIKELLEEGFRRHVDIVHFRERMNEFLKQRIRDEAVYV